MDKSYLQKIFRGLTAVLFALTLVGFGSLWSPSMAVAGSEDEERLANDMPIPLDSPEAIEKGRERFGERCGYCHGGGGKGAKGPCLVCGHFKRGGKSSNIYANIAGGIPNSQMGAFGTSLSQDEILNIIAYLRDGTKKHLAEMEKESK